MAKLTEQEQIAPDESAAAEPEIEPDERSEQKPEPDAPPLAKAESEALCPICIGFNGLRYGRKLHPAPARVDEQPVCLMHSKDPNKQSNDFWWEFERILQEAGEKEAHFERFVFPHTNFSGKRFKAICRFDEATFTRDANFNRMTFEQDAYLNSATFTQDADFREVNFMQNAYFYGAAFTQNARFHHAIFTLGAYFNSVTFMQNAFFRGASFTQNAFFLETTFMQDAYFFQTKFHGTADWSDSKFLDQAEFRHTEFNPKEPGTPSAVFSLARFFKPGVIVFEDVDLSRALFLNCDVSAIWFISSVQWAKRDGHRGLAVFEEEILLDSELSKKLKGYGKIDHGAVEQIYHQLQKNYDSRLDYRKANDFHYGEMEMMRLAGPTDGPILGLRRWIHRRLSLSLVALYRYASDYGNSYVKPFLWLFGFILVLFPALLPLPGIELKNQVATQESGAHIETETYLSVWNVQKTWGENLSAEVSLVEICEYNSLDAATFQKSAKYPPAYPQGRILAISESLLTSSLFALFLLAIRRQFRR